MIDDKGAKCFRKYLGRLTKLEAKEEASRKLWNQRRMLQITECNQMLLDALGRPFRDNIIPPSNAPALIWKWHH